VVLSYYFRLEESETLVKTLGDAGIKIAKKLKKAKHAKEAERIENERALRPQPVEKLVEIL
jgi:hypothetical protein